MYSDPVDEVFFSVMVTVVTMALTGYYEMDCVGTFIIWICNARGLGDVHRKSQLNVDNGCLFRKANTYNECATHEK